MERFDSPRFDSPKFDRARQKTDSSGRKKRSIPHSPFTTTGKSKPIPERLAVSGALLPVLFGIMLLWNWRFALALLAGSFAMNVGVSLQSPPWQHRLTWVRRRLPDGYGLSLLLAVTGGAIATLGTYTGLSMWMAGGDRWFTVAAIAQGIVSFGILCLLGLQTWHPSSTQTQEFDRALQNLTATEPLSRLLAVETLNQALTRKQASPDRQQLALDCLKLALQTEPEPSVRGRMQQALHLCKR